MFDIETSITNWRRNLLARESLRPEDVDELEDHLRQEIERLSSIKSSDNAALSVEEAFVIATRRLGRTEVIAEEFAKADPGSAWRRRWIWMLCGYVGFGLAFNLIVTASSFTIFYSREAGALLRNVLVLAVIVLGLASVVAVARLVGRTGTTVRLRRLLARRLQTTSGILALMSLVIAFKFALTPLWWIAGSRDSFERLPDGTLRPISVGFIQYAQSSLWIAPIAALAILIWLDRERFRRDEILLTSGESD